MAFRIVVFSLVLLLGSNSIAQAGRLFATSFTQGLVEINPLSGAILNTITPPEQAVWDGLAFDGQSLWFIGEDTDTLYQLNPNTGATQSSHPLPSDPFRSGMAFLNGLLYILDEADEDISIFDPQSGSFVGTLDINGLNPGSPQLGNSGVGAIPGSNSLFVTTAFTDEVLLLNPSTGVITSSFNHNQFGVLGGAGIGGEIFLGTNTGLTEQIYAYSSSGVELRRLSIPGSFGVQSLAGGESSSPTADFTGDGFVTGADFAQWEGDFGVNGDSDANGDNKSNGLDLLAWQRQFDGNGIPLASLHNIPEPSSGILVVCLALAVTQCRRLPIGTNC